MAEEQTIYCPFCGKNVPADVDKCPNCSTPIDRVKRKRELDQVIERRIMRKLKSSSKPKAEVPAPLPDAPPPDVKVSCPGCGLELKGGETKCSRCGVPLAGESDLLECPDCGSAFAPGAKKCPKCGVVFAAETDELLAPPEPEPEEMAEEQPQVVTPMPAEPISFGHGLTNGRGAINGTGLVNGTGMVNGTGLVNGTGMVNGTRADGRPSGRRGRAVARWQFLAVLVALVVIIPAFIYISYSKDSSAYSVDGDFGEWEDMDAYTMSVLTTTPITVVDEWSVVVDDTKVYFYVAAEGDIFGTTSVESLFLFVDSDGDASSGYAVGAMGAEFVIELDGWNGSVQSSDVSRYAPGSSDETYDWNAWESVGGAASRLEGGELEAMGNLQQAPSAESRFLLLSQDQMARRSVSSSVPAQGGVLVVTQSLSSLVPLSGIIPSAQYATLLTLTFRCDGAGGSVDSVAVELENLPELAGDIAPFTLEPGDVETVDVVVDTSALSPAQFVSARVSESGIESSFAAVIVTGHPARAYVGVAPASVHIDGAFGDWYGRVVSDVDLVEVANENIDIREVSVYNTSLSSSFFVSVDGEMCSGSFVPFLRGKPVPSDGGSVVPITRKTAEDITRIYIDSDMSSSTGLPMSVESKVIGADFRVEVRGVNCEAASAVLYGYSGTSWTVVSSELDAKVDAHRLEVAVLSYQIGGAAAIDFIIETTDWRQYRDYVALDAATMLALTGGISSTMGTLAWAVGGDSSGLGTASSYQRKLFYDGTNFWSLYFDGSNTVAEYSADGGASWTSTGAVFTTASVRRASLWYDSGAGAVYVIGDTDTSTVNVYVRKGIVTASPAGISWGTQNVLDVPGTNYPSASKNTFITKDSAGTVWISAAVKVHNTLSRYSLFTAYTSSTDDVTGSWTDGTALISGYTSTATCSATLIPGKSGSGVVVWAVYAYAGSVCSRTYSGTTWSTERTIYAYVAGNSVENTVYAPPSAVIDGSGVVHVVYGTGDIVSSSWVADIEYVHSTSTSTWSTALVLNGPGSNPLKYPTISLDTSTGNVYALWVEDGTSDSIMVKKNVTGTWSDLSVTQTSYVKNYLTSVYSVPGEAYICWQWTQNTSSPTVWFDKIPEFSDAVVPVLFVLTIFIAMYRRRARPEEPA